MEALLPPSDDPLLARALDAGAEAWRRGRLAAAQALLGQALVRAEARGDAAGLLSAHQLLGHVAFESGDLDAAQTHHETVLGQSQALGLPLGEASSLHNLGLIAAAQGDATRARHLISAAAARYETISHAPGATAARANLARLAEQWARQAGGADEHG
jgi:hypothetical protein